MAKIADFEDHCWKDVISEADMKLSFYERCARETFVGPSPALICIDLYNSAYRGGPLPPSEIQSEGPNSCGIYSHRAIEPTKKLIASARRAGIPVFFCTQDTRPHNRPPGAVSTRTKKAAGTRPDDYDIYHEFTPQDGDVVIYKQRASVFQGTPIVSHLSLLGVRSLIVCGESTSGCVRASVVDAYSTGFHVSVVEECTYDRVELSHKVNLFDLHHKYVDVMHVEEVVDHLDGMAQLKAAAE